MTESLTTKRCLACEGGVAILTPDQIQPLFAQLKNWQLSTDNKKISKTIKFNNFYETMAFANAVAWVANQENHHPDLKLSYSACEIEYWTHAVNGLTENDFICAAKIDALM